MASEREIEKHFRALPLDETFLELDPEEEAFFKAETRIQDTEELKKHIVEVQKEAYDVSRSRRADLCIRDGAVTFFSCSGLPISLHSWV